MIKVSIVCMIYKSPRFADWVYESVMKYTPMVHTGEAEFYFIANDPTEEVVSHLREKGYPFKIALHEKLNEQQLAELGFENREYLHRVYQAWNQGILCAKGERVCLINSDNYFSDNWLENLLKYSDYDTYVVPKLIEPRSRFGGYFWCADNKEYGKTPDTFLQDEFIRYADRIRRVGIRRLGVFQPCLFYKDVAIKAGLYPEGNLINKDGSITTGDTSFSNTLRRMNVKHITSLDSIVYHLGEGEMLDTESKEINMCTREYAGDNYIEMYETIPKAVLNPEALKKLGNIELEEKIEELIIPYEGMEVVDRFCDKLKSQIFKDSGTRKLYLFCAGRNGRKLHKDLQINGVIVEAYSDNNENLWGEWIDSIKCIAPSELDANSIVIVTKDNPQELMDILSKRNFRRIISYDEIYGIETKGV